MSGARQVVALACWFLGAAYSLSSVRVALAEPAPADVATQPVAAPVTTPAERDFRAGQQLFLEERYREALAYFRRSFQARPSPNSRLYVARCLAESGELLAAHEEYKRLIVQVSEEATPEKYAETQKAATQERSRLRSRLSWLHISIPHQIPGVVVTLAGQQLSQQDLAEDIYLLPGPIDLHATAPGYASFSQRLYLQAGQAAQVAIVWPEPVAIARPPPPAKVERPHANSVLPLAVVSAGVGLAGFGTWAAFALRADARRDDCRPELCSPAVEEAHRFDTTVSQVGLGVGVAGVLSGAILWVFGRSSPAQTPSALELSLGPYQVNVAGRF